jgi:hypothetical protein
LGESTTLSDLYKVLTARFGVAGSPGMATLNSWNRQFKWPERRAQFNAVINDRVAERLEDDLVEYKVDQIKSLSGIAEKAFDIANCMLTGGVTADAVSLNVPTTSAPRRRAKARSSRSWRSHSCRQSRRGRRSRPSLHELPPTGPRNGHQSSGSWLRCREQRTRQQRSDVCRASRPNGGFVPIAAPGHGARNLLNRSSQ